MDEIITIPPIWGPDEIAEPEIVIKDEKKKDQFFYPVPEKKEASE